jgi:hypothetical protein
MCVGESQLMLRKSSSTRATTLVLVTAATAVSFSEPLAQPQQLLQVAAAAAAAAAAVSGADVKCNAGGLFNSVCGVQLKRCVHINKQQQQQC